MKRNGISTTCATICIILALAASAQGASYDIKEIASDVVQLGAVNPGGLNEAGEVIYYYRTASGAAPDIYKYSGGSSSMVYDVGPSPALMWVTDGWNLPLNNIGFTTFVAQLNGAGGYGVYAGDGGPLTTIVESQYADPESPFVYLDNGPDINDANMVAFCAEDNVTWTYGLYKGDGGPLIEIATPNNTVTDQGDTFYLLYMQPVINNEGTTAFIGQLNPYSAKHYGIFKHNGSTVSTVYDTTGSFAEFYKPLDMNESGTVAFLAQTDAGPYGIYAGNGGPVTTIVDSSGPMMSFSNPAINNNGQVAFMAKYDGDMSKDGIFVGPDPVADKLLFEGESFNGGTITWLDLYRGINDAGQISFHMMIEYEDGDTTYTTRGVYLATPAECGDDNHPYPDGDLSEDCRVNMTDMALLSADWKNAYDMTDLATMALNWLTCNDPAGCP